MLHNFPSMSEPRSGHVNAHTALSQISIRVTFGRWSADPIKPRQWHWSASVTDSYFSSFATQQVFSKKKHKIVSRDGTRQCIFDFVVIGLELSEKFGVSEGWVGVRCLGQC